ARVTHAAPRRRRLARDEADDRLGHVLLHEHRGFLLIRAADFAHHRDCVRVRILFERTETIDEVRAIDRVPTDTGLGEEVHDFICERARTAHHANVAGFADAARDDADLGLTRCD